MKKIINEDKLKDHAAPSVSNEITSNKITDEALKRIVREASITTDKNWWFFFCVFLAILLTFMFIDNWRLRNELTFKYDVAWVKMYNSGSWDVEFQDGANTLDVLPSMVDTILSTWVEKRYSENKHTVQFDYGYARSFMSEEISSHFMSTEGFNAPQKAADIKTCPVCPTIRYKSGVIDHFDADQSSFGSEEGILYQSNVFTDREIKWSNEKNKTEHRIIRIKWRLMTPREIKFRINLDGGKDWIRINPIGLEIVDVDEMERNSNK